MLVVRLLEQSAVRFYFESVFFEHNLEIQGHGKKENNIIINLSI